MNGALGYRASSYRFERQSAIPAPEPNRLTELLAAMGGRSRETHAPQSSASTSSDTGWKSSHGHSTSKGADQSS